MKESEINTELPVYGPTHEKTNPLTCTIAKSPPFFLYFGPLRKKIWEKTFFQINIWYVFKAILWTNMVDLIIESEFSFLHVTQPFNFLRFGFVEKKIQ